MAMGTGIILGARLDLPGYDWFWWVLGVASLVVVVGFLVLPERSTRYGPCLITALLLLGAGISGVLLWNVHQPPAAPAFIDLLPSDDTFTVDVTRVGPITETTGGQYAWEGRMTAPGRPWHRECAMFFYQGEQRPLGSSFRISGQLQAPWEARNPGAFDYADYLAQRGIFHVVRVDEVTALRYGWPHRLFDQTQIRLRQSLQGDVAAVIEALALGVRQGVSDDLQARLRAAGVAHFLAISGLHVMTLGGLILLLFRRISGEPLGFLVAGSVVFGYSQLVGARPSTLRALTLFMLWLGSRYLGRPFDGHNALGAAALFLMVLRPACLMDPSFHLSFGAAWSLLSVYPRLRRTCETLPIPAWFGSTIALVGAILVGTSPFLLVHFGEIPLLGMVLAPLLAPFMLPVLLSAWGSALMAAFDSPSAIIHYLSRPVAWFIWGAGELGKVLPLWQGSSPNGDQLLLMVVILLIACPPAMFQALDPGSSWVAIPRIRCRHYLRWIGVGVLVVLVMMNLGKEPALLRVTVFDVGHGDCILLETPAGSTFLIDTGRPGWRGASVMARDVVPYLKGRGIEALDYVVITHGHIDHAGGWEDLADAIEVATLWLGPMGDIPVPTTPRVVKSVYRGKKIELDRVQIEVLWPDAKGDPTLDLNEASVAIKATLDEWSILLMGDVEGRGERQLLRKDGDRLEATVLKAGHHGSRNASSESFLARVRPEISIVSIGPNPHGLPADEAIERLARYGPVFITEAVGAVIMETDGRQWRIETMQSPSQRALLPAS